MTKLGRGVRPWPGRGSVSGIARYLRDIGHSIRLMPLQRLRPVGPARSHGRSRRAVTVTVKVRRSPSARGRVRLVKSFPIQAHGVSDCHSPSHSQVHHRDVLVINCQVTHSLTHCRDPRLCPGPPGIPRAHRDCQWQARPA